MMTDEEALKLAYRLLEEIEALAFRHTVGEDLIAWTCPDCGRNVVEDEHKNIEHTRACETGQFVGFMKDRGLL